MAVTITLGFVGMFLLFFGLRLFVDALVRRANGSKPLAVFGFRQIHENVATKSGTLAISSILILGALCCCGAGVGICISRQNMDHVLDYTFASYGVTLRRTAGISARNWRNRRVGGFLGRIRYEAWLYKDG